MSALRTIAALSAILIGGACGTTTVRTQRTVQPTQGRYETYAIEPGTVMTDHVKTAMPDQLVQNRINAAVNRELAGKGLQLTPKEDAELIVTYTASTSEKQDLVIDPSVMMAGSTFSGVDVWVQDFRQTILTIDMVDAGTGQVVWRATAAAMNKNLRSQKFIDRTIDMALAKFPQRGAF